MIVIKKFFLLLSLVVFLLPAFILAATDDFTIKAIIGEDTTPPSTPTLLSAVPVAPTQIDLTWSAATDNYVLGGYVLSRDSVVIATTSLTTFIDTGLIPETLYSYEVYAFDVAGNISTTSNALATTTPALPVIPPTPTSTPSETSSVGTLVFRLLGLDILPNTNDVLFKWQTSLPSRFSLRWGRNEDYEGGYISNDIYRKEHQTLITDLEPGTTYLYKLIGYTATGREVELKKGEFKTKVNENLTPANVQNLQAEVQGFDVSLSWLMPQQLPWKNVRIVRSHLGYPNDPYDGAVVYEGKENKFFDESALSNFSSQYYTVFVVGVDGSVSSGAVVRAKRFSSAQEGSNEPPPEDLLPLTEEEVVIPDFGFLLENIILQQGNKELNFKSNKIELINNEAFLIRIPYEALPKHLKSIVVTLLDPANSQRSYSFLLRINKDRTAYEAIIAPLQVVGPSLIQVEIFDYERKIIGRYRKPVDFLVAPATAPEVFFPDRLVKIIEPIFSTFFLLLLFIFLLFLWLYWRFRKTEDKQ